MTHDEAMEGEGHTITLEEARAELARHGCRIVATFTDAAFGGEPSAITVSNDFDPPEELPLNSKAILEWLGY